jgi:hypothetical protein
LKNKISNRITAVVSAGLAMWLMAGCADTGGWFGMQTKSSQEFPEFASSQPANVSPLPEQPTRTTDISVKPITTNKAPRDEADVTRQVNDQVERLKKAYEQSEQTKKSDVTITSVTPVDDSDSLAAKLTQKSVKKAPAKTQAPAATPAPGAKSEHPSITPIGKSASPSIASAKKTKTSAASPAQSKNVKILNVESMEAKKQVMPPTPAPAPTVTVGNKTLPSETITTSDQPANQSIKLDIPDPADNPSVAMDQLLVKLEKKLQERPDDTSTQVKLRLIYAVLGQWQQALKDNGGKDATDGELARDLVSLVKVFDNPDLAPAQQANEALNLLDRLQELLRRQADLKISSIKFCREVRSFGDYKTMPEEYFIAGKQLPVIVYLELENFTSKKIGTDNYQTLLSLTMEIVTESGKSCWKQHDDKIEDLANTQRRDFYIARLINLPAGLPAGKLGLRVMVEDLNGNKVTQMNLPFQLRAAR